MLGTQIPQENLAGSEIQGLRSTGSGSGSRAIISRHIKIIKLPF